MLSRYSDGTDWTARVQFPAMQDFSLPHSIHTDSVSPGLISSWYQGALSPGVKQQGCESDLLPPSNAEVKKSGATPPRLHMSSWYYA
jgi:hypothetical protein